MSLFDWLLTGHLIGDFLIQTEGMARLKQQSWSWMLKHICSYMVVVTVIVVIYGVRRSLPAWLIVVVLLFILTTHTLLDLRGFTTWWMGLVGVAPDHPWMPTVVDQVFHILTLAIAAQFLVLAGG
jgi:hypothetical protein